jgi:hypothetical protein
VDQQKSGSDAIAGTRSCLPASIHQPLFHGLGWPDGTILWQSALLVTLVAALLGNAIGWDVCCG